MRQRIQVRCQIFDSTSSDKQNEVHVRRLTQEKQKVFDITSSDKTI